MRGAVHVEQVAALGDVVEGEGVCGGQVGGGGEVKGGERRVRLGREGARVGEEVRRRDDEVDRRRGRRRRYGEEGEGQRGEEIAAHLGRWCVRLCWTASVS